MEGYLHVNPKRILLELDFNILNRRYDEYERWLSVISEYWAKVFDNLPEEKKREFHEVLIDTIGKDPICEASFWLQFTGVQLGRREILQNPNVPYELVEKDIQRLEHLANGGLKIKLNENN